MIAASSAHGSVRSNACAYFFIRRVASLTTGTLFGKSVPIGKMAPPDGLRQRRRQANGGDAAKHAAVAPAAPSSGWTWKTVVRWCARLALLVVLFLSCAQVVHVGDRSKEKEAGRDDVASSTTLLVITHSRAEYLSRCLNSILRNHPGATGWRVLVSADRQDGVHVEVDAVIGAAQKRAMSAGVPFSSMAHEVPYVRDFADDNETQNLLIDHDAYRRISKHYVWALTRAFETGAERVVVVEDDMEIADDFYSYFDALAPLLHADPTLYCVSAWNDNGKERIAVDHAQLHRTDFFPGLGWMLTRATWEELKGKWPKMFWDDWMRAPEQTRGRQCVRPEVSRTRNFGVDGASTSFQYLEHISKVRLAEVAVNFSAVDLGYLAPKKYEELIFGRMSRAVRLRFSNYLTSRPQDGDVIAFFPKGRLTAIGKRTGIMTDDRNGVYRTGYKGVVVIPWNGHWAFLVEQGYQPPEGYPLGSRQCCD